MFLEKTMLPRLYSIARLWALAAALASLFAAFGAAACGEDAVVETPRPVAETPVAVEPPVVPEDVRAEIRFRVDSGYNMSIVVGLVNAGGATYYSYGTTSAGSGVVPTEDTVFEIASITKAFTALMLVELASRGELSLGDTIADHLPATALSGGGSESISLTELATHTAGFPRLPDNLELSDPDRPYAGYTVSDLYRYLSRFVPPPSAPRYSYSNLGYGLLGHVLERQSGKSYGELVASLVTGELGMSDTGIEPTADMRARTAQGYSGVVEMPRWENTTLAGAGRLLSTARDMVTFLAANLGFRETALRDAMRRTHEPRLPTGERDVQIALGWHVKTVGGRQIVWHDGGTGGYSSYAGFLRDGGVGVVVLSNTFESVNDIGVHLLAPDVPMETLPAPAQIDPTALERYVGSYEFSPAGTMEVRLKHGHLTAAFESEPEATLYPRGRHGFYYRVTDARITFVEDDRGEVSGLILHQPRSDYTAVRRGAAPETVARAAAPSEVIMVPFTNEDFGIRGVVPAGWVEFVPGGYKRAAADDVALYQQVADGGATVEGVLGALSKELMLDDPPLPAGAMDTAVASWSLFAVEAQGQSFDIAVAEHGGRVVAVVLRSVPTLRSFYREGVFLPAVEAVTVVE